jgi:hypothetical protein
VIPQTEDLLPTETFPRCKTLRGIYNISATADDQPRRSFTFERPVLSIPHSRASSEHSRAASQERRPRPFRLHEVAWDDENNRPLEPIKLDSPTTQRPQRLFEALRKPFRKKKEEVRNEAQCPFFGVHECFIEEIRPGNLFTDCRRATRDEAPITAQSEKTSTTGMGSRQMSIFSCLRIFKCCEMKMG